MPVNEFQFAVATTEELNEAESRLVKSSSTMRRSAGTVVEIGDLKIKTNFWPALRFLTKEGQPDRTFYSFFAVWVKGPAEFKEEALLLLIYGSNALTQGSNQAVLLYSLTPIRYEILSLGGSRVSSQLPLRTCPPGVQEHVMRQVGDQIPVWIANDLQCRDRCTHRSPVADSSSKRVREIRCAKCVYVCTLSSEMATHQLSHKFECKKCRHNCSTATDLKKHQQTHKPVADPVVSDKKRMVKKRKGQEPSAKQAANSNKKAKATLAGDDKEEELEPPEETNGRLAGRGGHGSAHAGAAGGRGTNPSSPPPPPPSQAPAKLAPINVVVNLPPTDEAKEDAAVARALRMQAPALQMAFRSLEFLGQAACQKTGVSTPAAGAAIRPSEVLTDAHAEFIGILKAHPGLEGLAWLDFSTITTAEMEAWIKEAGGLKFGPKKALDRLHLSAKVENAKR